MTYLAKPARGIVIGRFLPPHAGHVYLCDFARACVDSLTLLVCSRPDDPIPGAQRVAWMHELFPAARILHCDDGLPPEASPPGASADPSANSIGGPPWRDLLRRFHPEPLDILFASESYGHRLAAEAGARFVPVDLGHATVPVSSAAIRENPYAHWSFIPPPVRRHYLRRVTLFGTESCGKTTLATDLAAHFDTVVAPEFGRFHTEAFGGGADTPEDIRQIVTGHLAGVEAIRDRANRVLIEDTDPVLTALWSDELAGSRDPWFANYRDYPDLYLFCDIDIPWVNDGVRYFTDPERRRRFHDACEAELVARGVNFIRISGNREQRLACAVRAITPLVQP